MEYTNGFRYRFPHHTRCTAIVLATLQSTRRQLSKCLRPRTFVCHLMITMRFANETWFDVDCWKQLRHAKCRNRPGASLFQRRLKDSSENSRHTPIPQSALEIEPLTSISQSLHFLCPRISPFLQHIFIYQDRLLLGISRIHSHHVIYALQSKFSVPRVPCLSLVYAESVIYGFSAYFVFEATATFRSEYKKSQEVDSESSLGAIEG